MSKQPSHMVSHRKHMGRTGSQTTYKFVNKVTASQTTGAQRIYRVLEQTFMSLGYLSCFMLWAWVLILYLPKIFAIQGVHDLMLPDLTPTHQAEAVSVPHMPISVALTIAAVTTVIMLIVTIIVIVMLPKNVGKSGDKITHIISESATPLVLRHKKVPPKIRRKISWRLHKIVLLLVSSAPLLPLLVIKPAVELDDGIIVFLSSILSILSIILFFVGTCFNVKLANITKN